MWYNFGQDALRVVLHLKSKFEKLSNSGKYYWERKALKTGELLSGMNLFIRTKLSQAK